MIFLQLVMHKKKVPISISNDSIKKKSLPRELARLIKDYPNTFTDGLPRKLCLYVGMPVFLTKNIATELGLTNGTTGVVRKIYLKNAAAVNEEIGFHEIQHSSDDYVIVEFDEIKVKPLDGLEANQVPIFSENGHFQVRVKGRKNAFSVKRSHFPLVPRFSCTSHKSQGQTLNKAIVDLVPLQRNRRRVETNFAYVPLSRVRTLNDLTILRPFEPSIMKCKKNEACAAMMQEFEERNVCRRWNETNENEDADNSNDTDEE